MAKTPEGKIKDKLNAKDKKLAEKANLLYRRLTFGPYGVAGTPDRLANFGHLAVFNEVKKEGSKPTPLQEHKLKEARQFGYPAMATCGQTGIDSYYDELLELFSEDNVAKYVDQYIRDAVQLRKALEELK